MSFNSTTGNALVANSFVMSIEGEVAYTDGSKASFGASVDPGGNIETEGLSTAMGDVISTVQGLFTALGGSLTCTPGTTTKTVKDQTVRMEGNGTLDDGTKFNFFAESTSKTGTLVGGGVVSPTADFQVAVTNFKATMQSVIAAIAGVSATISSGQSGPPSWNF